MIKIGLSIMDTFTSLKNGKMYAEHYRQHTWNPQLEDEMKDYLIAANHIKIFKDALRVISKQFEIDLVNDTPFDDKIVISILKRKTFPINRIVNVTDDPKNINFEKLFISNTLYIGKNAVANVPHIRIKNKTGFTINHRDLMISFILQKENLYNESRKMINEFTHFEFMRLKDTFWEPTEYF